MTSSVETEKLNAKIDALAARLENESENTTYHIKEIHLRLQRTSGHVSDLYKKIAAILKLQSSTSIQISELNEMLMPIVKKNHPGIADDLHRIARLLKPAKPDRRPKDK